MDGKYNDAERLYLTAEEIEFIKHTIINPNVKTSDTVTMQWFGWRANFEIAIYLRNEKDPKIIEQYERIREIEFLFEILKDDYCKSIIDLSEKMHIMDEKEKEFNVKVMLEETMADLEYSFEQRTLESLLEEEYDQNLSDPFVEDLIKELMRSKVKDEKFIKLDRIIKAADFKYIDDKTILSIASLLLKEYDKAKKENKSLYIQRRGVEKSAAVFLFVKNLKHFPFGLGNNNSHKKK